MHMGPPCMIQAYNLLDLTATNCCGCEKNTMFHKIGLCSIIAHCKGLADRQNLTDRQNLVEYHACHQFPCDSETRKEHMLNEKLVKHRHNVIGIDFSVLQWKIVERLIRGKEWPKYDDVYASYQQLLTQLENRLSDVLGVNNYVVYAFIDGYAKNRLKYLTRYNRSYESSISMASSFPILSPGSYLWNIIQECYSCLEDRDHVKLIQSVGESDGYMIDYLKQFTDSYITICSVDSDIPLLALQLPNCRNIISLTSNKQYNVIDVHKLRLIVQNSFRYIEDFLFVFYLFVRNDFHYGISMYNDPVTFFNKVMPCATNFDNISDPCNLHKFLRNVLSCSNQTVENQIFRSQKETVSQNTEELTCFLRVSYSVMNNYYIDSYKIDKNTSCYYTSPHPVDLCSLIDTVEQIVDSTATKEDYVYQVKNDFIETLAFLPRMDYARFEKVIQRMFPLNISDNTEIRALWDIFSKIKDVKTEKSSNYYQDMYGNLISNKNKKICLPADFDRIYEQFFSHNSEIQHIYGKLVSSHGVLPDCTSIIDVCRDYERNGFCKYIKCRYRHVQATPTIWSSN